MHRKKFLKDLGIGTAAILFMSSLESCVKDAPENVDFTIDLTSNSYLSLRRDGGYL
ncbi:MAG: hypothetical protein IH946_12115, partial [Bacteroidetes bacterium]|nr:hypothetical protein [Bacteroidota bacterium]